MKIHHSFSGLRRFMKGRFNLHEDSATQNEIVERIESGVVIRGTNLWVLVFATVIASVGLNVNSTAVIIGAMLISPLMGPIMGMGLALGINDFDLLKRSAKNFGFMTVISILASTLYFMVSPWSGAQSELLARTQPTTFDVLIAFFGGLAGIVGQTRKEKSITVIPGVAIATALMPPLCTAGYGLATQQYSYFAGAFYLFIINTVFIAIASYVITNSMKFEKKVFVDMVRGRKVRRIMASIVFITIVPSVIIGYNLTKEMLFKQNVQNFIAQSFDFKDTRVVDYKVKYNPRRSASSSVEVVLYGKPLSKEVIETLRTHMAKFDIYNTSLLVQQGEDNSNLASTFIQSNFEQLIKEKNEQISVLSGEVNHFKNMMLPASELSREMGALLNTEVDVMISRAPVYDNTGNAKDTLVLCYIRHDGLLSASEQEKLSQWLKVRTKTEHVKIIQ